MGATIDLTNFRQEVMEVLTGPERRRRWTVEQKLAMVRESLRAGKIGFDGRAPARREPEPAVPLAQALLGREPVSGQGWRRSCPCIGFGQCTQADRELQRMLGKKTTENENVCEAVEYGRAEMDSALAFAAGGRPVKLVCEVLGVSRSNVSARLSCPATWRDGRQSRHTDDASVVEEIRRVVGDLPSMAIAWFGARCATNALRLGWSRSMQSASIPSCAHTTAGHSGDIVRDVMLTAVGNRFGNALHTPSEIEWLSDNGSGYTADDTRQFARNIGLKPLTTPVYSPQSNGMAESFVKTMKLHYVAFMPKPDAATAARNLAIAFEH